MRGCPSIGLLSSHSTHSAYFALSFISSLYLAGVLGGTELG